MQESNRESSQEWKSKLEEFQRADRRLRQQGRKQGSSFREVAPVC